MKDIFNPNKRLKAVLVGVHTPRMSDAELSGSLDELARLVTTLGYDVMGRLSQKRKSDGSATVLGEGKLRELASWTGGTGKVAAAVIKKKHRAALKFDKNKEDEEDDSEEFESDDENFDADSSDDSSDDGNEVSEFPKRTELAETVIVDSELSPSQLRNLESALGVPVLDRTGVIIEIFAKHAKTRAARLQVEIARLTYIAPRLRETTADEDRGGGGVGAKGAGETGLELDRRRIRDRIKELRTELESISSEHDVRRSRRNQEITVALVGYTNAGKSSLMRALTGSDVLIADKLFATLDTTVRVLYPETTPKILVSDTVGFIKKLPHDLVASFKSTLDEALNASLLLFVVDSSDVGFRSQLQVTRDVLNEVGAGDVPSLLILNKIDKVPLSEHENLRREFPDAVMMSAKSKSDVVALRLQLVGTFETEMVDQDLLVPYNLKGAVGEIRSKMRVLSEDYNDQGVVLKVRAAPDAIKKLRTQFGI